MKRTAWIAAGCVALCLVITGQVLGYTLYDNRPKWTSDPNITVDNRGLSGVSDGNYGISRTISAITSSSAWNGAGSGTVVNAHSGSVSGFATCSSGTPMLNFQDPDSDCTGSCLALTTTCWWVGSYQIFDADIVTNNAFNWTSRGEDPDPFWDCFWDLQNEYYIEGVMVHEVGHVLGIGHSSVSGATMWPSVGSCDYSTMTTESDDELGLTVLYGKEISVPGYSSTTIFNQFPGNTQYKAVARVYVPSGTATTEVSLTGQGHNNDAEGIPRTMRVQVNGNTYTVISWLNDGETKSFTYYLPGGVLQTGWNDITAYIHWGNEDYDDGHWVSLTLHINPDCSGGGPC